MFGNLQRPSEFRIAEKLVSSFRIIAIVVCILFISNSFQPVTVQRAQESKSIAPNHRHDDGSASSKETRNPEIATAARTPRNRSGFVTLESSRIALPDVEVLDQDGKKRRFYSDLIKDRIVVLSFFYTRCVTVCPSMNMRLRRLQTDLADRLSKDIFIVTVTMDPKTDTPERLKAWGNVIGVKAGWTMVTGETDVIAKLVRDFTGEPLGGQSYHSAEFFLGNDLTGSWTSILQYSGFKELQRQIDLLARPAETRGRSGS